MVTHRYMHVEGYIHVEGIVVKIQRTAGDNSQEGMLRLEAPRGFWAAKEKSKVSYFQVANINKWRVGDRVQYNTPIEIDDDVTSWATYCEKTESKSGGLNHYLRRVCKR